MMIVRCRRSRVGRVVRGLILALAALAALQHLASASVTLLYVRASVTTTNRVLVTWETGAEINTLYFLVYRNETGSEPWGEPVSEPIPSESPDGGISGGLYQFEDAGVRSGATYYYLLTEVERDQVTVRRYTDYVARISVGAGPPSATPTRTRTATPTATATIPPSRTPTRTPTPAPSLTPTAPPRTDTPPPTATRRFTNTPPATAAPAQGAATLSPASLTPSATARGQAGNPVMAAPTGGVRPPAALATPALPPTPAPTTARAATSPPAPDKAAPAPIFRPESTATGTPDSRGRAGATSQARPLLALGNSAALPADSSAAKRPAPTAWLLWLGLLALALSVTIMAAVVVWLWRQRRR